jgi:hypothetical protein
MLRVRQVLMQGVNSYFRFCTPGKLDDDLEFFVKLDIFCTCGALISMARENVAT